MNTQQMKVQLRNDWKIKPEALQINGKVFKFIPMHELTEDDTSIYVGETAMMAVDPSYPDDAPSWIASGDLVTA
jgi:hypothetical protein